MSRTDSLLTLGLLWIFNFILYTTFCDESFSNRATHHTAPTDAANASASQDGEETKSTKSVKAISHYCMCVLLSASAMQPAFSRVMLLLVAISALACHAAHALRGPPQSIECTSPSRVSGCAHILSFSIFLFCCLCQEILQV